MSQKYRRLKLFHSALFEITELANDCKDIESFYKNVHRIVATLTDANNFFIVMYEQSMQTLQFVYQVDENDNFPKEPVPYHEFDGSLSHYVIESAKPLLATPEKIERLSQQGKISKVGTVGIDWLGVPLIRDGYVVGVIAVQSYTEDTRYTDEDQELLTFAAQHVVNAMVRFQDKEQLQQAVAARTTELMAQIRERERSELLQESLFHISQLTNADIEIDKFYDQVHNIVGQLLSASNFYIAKLDNENQLIKFVYYIDQSSKSTDTDYKTRPVSRYLTEYVLRQGKTVLLDKSSMMALYEAGEIDNINHDNYSWLGVPLVSGTDTFGVMVVQSYQANIIFTEQDGELLNFVSQHVTSAIQRREAAQYQRKVNELLEHQVKVRTAELEEEIQQRQLAEEQLKHAASYDTLTGLPNRRVFLDLLNHAIALRKRKESFNFAVLFLDLDRFKAVNDSMGHHAGDTLLKIVAKELTSVVREMDTVARLGGDEFVILIEDIENDNEAIVIADRITRIIQTPFTIENQQVFIGTSIGLLFGDDRYQTADVMLRDADTAMYYAKDKGKGRYEVFDSSMHEKVQNSIQLEADIRRGIKKKEFVPYFQPVVEISTGNVVGFEALARWHCKNRGLVMPNDFIPLAEETGLVVDIDLLILDQALIYLRELQQVYALPKLYVSVNLFCTHFYNKALNSHVATLIAKHQVSADCIRLELTERALIDNAHIVLRNIKLLKRQGVKILLDDFGTGYSSLSYLYRFPIDVLKIDRSFIHNMKTQESNRAIVKTIIDLANNMGMDTIGEGVEDSADSDALAAMQCKYGQGYYYARPMSIDEVKTFLTQAK